MRALKVFRTPIGFHDAYVAAPTKKAALAAWGSDKNLFARGDAEEVTDATLMREPLAHPGEVIRRARGTEAEHLASVSKRPGKRVAAKRSATSAPAKKAAKPPPRPNRDKLDAAQEALDDARETHDAAIDDLRAREKALAQERHELERRQSAEVTKLETARDRATQAYEAKLDAWRGKMDDIE